MHFHTSTNHFREELCIAFFPYKNTYLNMPTPLSCFMYATLYFDLSFYLRIHHERYAGILPVGIFHMPQ